MAINKSIPLGKVCSNTETDMIEITDDKLRNILSTFIQDLKKVQLWLVALTLVLTILLAILTADFNKDFIGISRTTWSAIFYVSLAISIGWLIRTVIDSYKLSDQTKIDYLVSKIRNDK